MTDDKEGSFSGDLSFFLNVSLGKYTSTPTSTPSKKSLKNRGRAPRSPFKKPAAVTAFVAVCKLCGKGYKTIRFYKQHMQGHALKDLASKLPESDSCQVAAIAPDVALKVIDVIEGKPQIGLLAVEFVRLIENIKSEKTSDMWKGFLACVSKHFKCLMTKEVFCMPSSLMVTSLQMADDILTSLEERDILISVLGAITDNFTVPVIQSFLCEFILTFADQLVIHICRLLRDASSSCADIVPVPVSSFNLEERQAIFYIGGSIFRGFKRLSYTYPNSAKWRSISELIHLKVLEEKSMSMLTEQEKQDRLWVEKNNRGGLIFLRGGVQEFLMSCACIIAAHEESDGSLPLESIISKVVSGKPKFDWDAVVGTALDQNLSFSLMVGVVRSFTNTHGKGIILRRMNKINNNKATASVSLRHKVAPKL